MGAESKRTKWEVADDVECIGLARILVEHAEGVTQRLQEGSLSVDLHGCTVEQMLLNRPERTRLLVKIAPQVERCAALALRKCGLHSTDDARYVLVEILAVLQSNQYRTLADFVHEASHEPSFDVPTPFIKYVRTITRRRAVSHARKRLGRDNGKKHLVTGAQRPGIITMERLQHATEDIRATPANVRWVLARELRSMVDALLPQDQRAVYDLWLEGLEPQEINDKLGTQDAERVLRRAKDRVAQLKKKLFAIG